ncbi:MAG: mannitol-phosphate 5-dehydrogenase [Actinomycetota bacterium]|jgi:mannitol-1-phosphate 5-dehydrogenase|nr:mannitol-phosphate 5-dehydrogenase [Actinomycetota bacterium]
MTAQKAVHFGAGNIGRGFVGLILHNAGYEVVFADVNAELIDALAASRSYLVREVGAGASTSEVTNYRALNSASHQADVVAEIATADVVTTAVGPNILRFVAPLIAAALADRSPSRAPLAVMACENAINATDLLKAEVAKTASPEELARAVFANTAVDRIVPGQPEGGGLDVVVEAFFEWAVESGPFGDHIPVIPEAHFVDDLAPYIQRKLFTVNTGHATTAYHGFLAGASSISEAVTIPSVEAAVRAVLEETKALLVAKFDFPPVVQQQYIETNLTRFANQELTDTVDRVGRQPLRKLSRHERFVGPAAELAELGLSFGALVDTMGAALRFDVPEDPQSVEMLGLLDSLSPHGFVLQVTGLEPAHPLFPAVLAAVEARGQTP